MDKRAKRSVLIVVCVGVLVGSLVYAAYWVYSNTVQVTVGVYSLTLSADRAAVAQNELVVFSGRLSANTGALPVANKNITLFRNDAPVGWNLTDASGYFRIVYNASETGTFTFKAGFFNSP